MDQFKQINTFVQVVERGSLTAAARHEGIAPAMVSRRIDALEARLGVKLLRRTTRRVTPTPEGKSYAQDCQRILRELQDAESAVAARGTEARGHLRVTAPAGFGRKHVAPLAAAFAQMHPGVTLTLDLSDRVNDLVADGYDCAIRFGEIADGTLVRLALGASRRLVVAAPDYLQRHGAPAHPGDLGRHACLTLGDSGVALTRSWVFAVEGQAQAFRPGGPLVCNDGAVLREWTLAGLGLAWRSLWEVGEDLAAGRLVSVLDRYEAPPTPVYCVFPARKHLPQRVRLWVDFVKQRFSAAPLAQVLGGGAAPRRRRA